MKKQETEKRPFVHCFECQAKSDMISFLRTEIVRMGEEKRRTDEINMRLTDKLVLFSEGASEREHRLKMTELAHMKPAPMEGIVSRDDLMMDDTGMAVDQLIEQITSSRA